MYWIGGTEGKGVEYVMGKPPIAITTGLEKLLFIEPIGTTISSRAFKGQITILGSDPTRYME